MGYDHDGDTLEVRNIFYIVLNKVFQLFPQNHFKKYIDLFRINRPQQKM